MGLLIACWFDFWVWICSLVWFVCLFDLFGVLAMLNSFG